MERELDGKKHNIVVNFSPTVALSAGFTGKVIASYNGATATSIPPLSAILIEN